MNIWATQALKKALKNATVHPVGGLEEKLADKKTLVIKLGFDPTQPDIHLGHYVILNKLRAFQDAGHQVAFLIGDFTCLIGDPTGKNTARPSMTPEQVLKNSATYADQVFKILRKDQTTLLYNSSWFNQFTAYDFIQLLAQASLSQILAREDFSKRYQQSNSILLHELTYPVLQAYDSVAIKADVEIGGQDQLFNLLMGRELQKKLKLPQQVVITYPLLLGLYGQEKMSKSLANTIKIKDEDMFGKVLSISDEVMKSYYELMDIDLPAGFSLHETGKRAMDLKIYLAHHLVSKFFSVEKANLERERFIATFSRRELSEELYKPTVINLDGKDITLNQLLQKLTICKSASQANRLIQQGAVEVEGLRILDKHYTFIAGKTYKCKFGKKNYIKVAVL